MSRSAVVLLGLVLAITFTVAVAPAAAHPLDPALLELTEAVEGTLAVLWRVPAAQPRDAPLVPVLPEHCRQLEPASVGRDAQRASARWRMRCASSLVGERVGVAGLEERQTDALLRLRLADGRLIQTVLRPGAPSIEVPAARGRGAVLGDYLVLGFEHILGGVDHLLFVFGLMLLVAGWRPLLLTITAFTAGHSVTLSLAALGLVRLPSAPIEVLIALSIFAVAVELTRRADGRPVARWRSPWAIAFVFGLLHGFGFAGALIEVGLPAGEVPAALFAFNTGIELGQLLFVGMLLLATTALARLPFVWPPAVARVPAYVIGSLAAFWVFERAATVG